MNVVGELYYLLFYSFRYLSQWSVLRTGEMWWRFRV